MDEGGDGSFPGRCCLSTHAQTPRTTQPKPADESEEEEDEEEPVLKFEDEPLEANEVVLMPDGGEGVVEGIRRGNVVVRGVLEIDLCVHKFVCLSLVGWARPCVRTHVQYLTTTPNDHDRTQVRTENGVMETFKLEEVKRKHVAPPGYVRPESAWSSLSFLLICVGCFWLGVWSTVRADRTPHPPAH